jgi:type IV pilus assembly protein PilM
MDWKKETKLSDLFGRKPKATKQPAEKPTPFWKKEMTFRRKPKAPPAQPPALEPVADEDWVREQLAAAAAAAEAPPPPEPGIHPPVPASELPPERKDKKPKQSLLKKEISFRRKTKAPKAPAPAEKPVPFWKKELSLKRKRKEPKPPREPKAKRPRRELKLPSLRRPGKRVVGLKIGASQLAAARVANNGHAELLQVAREPLEPGVVVGGELRDPDALADALKAFFRKHNLPKRGIRLGIANNRIGVRTLEIVGIVDPKQLANAIRFRAQEALPIPVEEAVLDYQILSQSQTEAGERVCRVLLVVAYRELVDRYVAACRKAGVGVAGIDLEAFALLRSLEPPRAEDAPAEAALVAVAIGSDRSTFAVSNGRVCEFTRVLEWGGEALDAAVAQALDLTPREAEPIKRSLSLAVGPAPEGLTEEQAMAARDAMRRQVQSFARELVSSLQFYQGQPGSLGIGEIVLTGGTAHLDGLAEDLQRLIGVRVRLGDPLGRVKVGKRLRPPDPVGSLAVAIGLGIDD